MRQITENEKQLLEKLVQLKQSARLEELQVATLLRKELNCFALRWNIEPNKTLVFYSTRNNGSKEIDWDALRKSYFQVADFLYFVEELEKENFIKIQTLSFELKNDNERMLYDRGKYKYDDKNDRFWFENDDIIALCSVNAQRKVFIDFVEYLERYANKVVYPLPLLEDFVKNKYKTIEQRNFEKQLEENNNHHIEQIKKNDSYHKEQMDANNKWQERQISKTNWSLFISAMAVMFSAVIPVPVNKCASPTKIEDSQLKEIKEAIIQSKTIIPDSIVVRQHDTLNVKRILPSVKIDFNRTSK